MSVYKKKVNNFIHLLKIQPDLFTESHRSELIQILDNQEDNIKSLANLISNWLKKYPYIDNALSQFNNEGGNSRAPGEKKANPNIPEYQPDKKNLLNAIQNSSPPPKRG